MRWFKLTVAYDGTEFSGWQRQSGRRTVQGTLEAAWRSVTGEDVEMSASGRTDAGVHALGQVVGVATRTHLDEATLVRAFAAKLRPDVVVRSVEPAPEGFDATRDAVGKRYRYIIHCGQFHNPFSRRYAWRIGRPLDVGAMHRAGQALVGTHDFASFQAAGSPRESTVRTIVELNVQGRGGEWGDEVTVEIEGDGFLYKMVRTIVGTLVELGRGRRPEEWMTEVLAARQRGAAGQTAPPQGLFLVGVKYADPGTIDDSAWEARGITH